MQTHASSRESGICLQIIETATTKAPKNVLLQTATKGTVAVWLGYLVFAVFSVCIGGCLVFAKLLP